MQCSEFSEFAGQWFEGERTPQAEAHVAGCARCQSLLADMEAIASAGRELDTDLPEVPERIWIGLRAQLESEGLIRIPADQSVASPQSWTEVFSGLFSMLRRPAVAMAYATAVILAVLVMQEPGGVVPGAGILQAPEIADISSVEKVARGALPAMQARNPIVATTYRDNLAIVDKFISVCEKSVRENPDDTIARDYLLQAYQQKVELISTMAERGAGD